MKEAKNYTDFEQRFEAAWQSPPPSGDIIDRDALYKKIAEQTGFATTITATKRNFLFKRMLVAAVFTGVVILSVVLIFSNTKKQKDTRSVANTSTLDKLVTLPDRSVVVLEPGAEITYHREFGEKNREVHLKGTAMFTVEKQANLPFSVFSGPAIVQVSGTIFKVYNRYSTDTITSISVQEGRVRFGRNDTPPEKWVTLEKGDSAVLQHIPEKITASAGQPQYSRASLHFINSSFDNVLDSLKNHYQKKFIVRKKIQKPVSVAFTDASLETILTVLSVTLDFRFEAKGDSVIIK